MRKLIYLSTVLLATSAGILAAGEITNFSLKGQAVPAGPILDTITIDGVLYDATSMVNGEMTGFTDSGQVQLMAGKSTTSAPAVGQRSDVMSDLRLDTAMLNINEIVFTFDQAILNTGSGKIDVVIFDWGAFNGDDFSVTIDGNTISGLSDANVPTGGDVHTESISLTSNWFATPSPHSGVTTVDELNTMTFGSVVNSSSGGTQGVIGLDLTDFGVAIGGSITQMTISETGTVSVDPSLILGVQAIPEPSSIWMLGLGVISLFLGGTKRRCSL
ncbi:PEP-CTERM sorting domain-containing protein [Kiritimatiellota bacterium B12222]|nr:PEP-CTERM sorting domain-containing protein [Kiritimatiellota bacterium B12222]